MTMIRIGQMPGGRRLAAAVAVFGGHGTNGQLDDTWTWNGSTWTQQDPATHPAPRYDGTMAYDAATGTVVLFGGRNAHSVLGDTWTWDCRPGLDPGSVRPAL